MNLAKNAIDIGLQTNTRDPMLAFWQTTVGLPYEELLKVGNGTHQHRLGLNGSVFKLNHLRDPLEATDPSGYRQLYIAREGIDKPVHLEDPDGNQVSLVPPGWQDITHLGMRIDVSDLKAFAHFYGDILGANPLGDNRFRWGTTVIELREVPGRAPTAAMRGIGYRYLTVQVWKVDEEHARILSLGGGEGRAPATLGSTARISFVTDPDNNWIEISQRASLTGDLS